MKNYLIIFGGISALFLGIGVSRFAFTPIMPLMQSEFALNNTVSGALASVNLIGYLVGAFAARYIMGVSKARFIFIISLLFCALGNGLMGIESIYIWYISRFLTGLLTGIMFIYASEVVLSYLIKENKMHLFGMMFSGVGAGIAFSGLVVPYLSSVMSVSQIWLFLGAVGIIPAVCSTIFVPAPEIIPVSNTDELVTTANRKLYILYAAYLLAGIGYIISGTFMSVMILDGTGSLKLSGYSWVMVGLGAIIVTPFWSIIAKRVSTMFALILAFLLQAVSISMPVLFSGTFSALLGAFCFGGSFLGVVALALAYGRELHPGKQTAATLTIYFGIGQIVGPTLAGVLSDRYGGFDIPVLLAASIMLMGGVLIYLTKGEKHAVR